jgi:thiol:disulfide interchange protein
MKLLFWTMMVLAVVLLLSSAALSQEPGLPVKNGILDPVTVKTDLYPAAADATKEIAEALKVAATDHKRVLLVFGANWCYDCHVLDRALHDGAAGKIANESFVMVHVDVGEADKNLDLAKQYKIPLDKGVPAVAILGSDGKLLYGSRDGEFEAARKMMKKDLVAFLTRWVESAPKKAGH